MNVRLHPAAAEEIAAAARWYEERQPGLGMELLDVVAAALSRVAAAPEQFGLWEVGSDPDPPRRCLLQRFPFAILYDVASTEVHVLAFAHLRRHPGYWRARR